MRDKSESGAGEAGWPAATDHNPESGVLNPDLSWTHYRLLTKAESPLARDFYEIEPVRNHHELLGKYKLIVHLRAAS